MITTRQINLLRKAVDMAEEWRGNLVGAAPAEALDEFDAELALMRQALRAIYAARKELLTYKAKENEA